MEIKIALAGNPNCGKTTLFNALTGSNQYVGNWPGVTVEKKEGRLRGHKDVIIQDLPGIYSLSPYTLEEVVARSYLVNEKPDAILNIVDGTNIERNLYLTTQLIELGLPVVVAVNMIDLVRKNGDTIDLAKLGTALGCEVVEMSALKGEGGLEAAEKAVALAQDRKAGELPHVFTGSVEHALAHIEESIQGGVDEGYLRWYAIKLFERDEKVLEDLKLDKTLAEHLDEHIADCEKELDDDAESIITNQRYAYINGVVSKAVKKKAPKGSLSVSDKIDQIVTNRVLALPIFAVVMFCIYAIAMGGWPVSIGTMATDWANDVLFGELVPGAVRFGPLVLRHNPALSQQVQEMPVTDARLARNFPGSLWRLTLTAPAAKTLNVLFLVENGAVLALDGTDDTALRLLGSEVSKSFTGNLLMVEKGASVYLKHATLSGSKRITAQEAAAVFVNGYFNMSGGVIENCQSNTVLGGTVTVRAGAKMDMTGGTIRNN